MKTVVLLILDGWGIAPDWGANALTKANTENFDTLWKKYPHSKLEASGEYVGLPGHEAGNSEVGHLNIGAGRIVYQDSSRISKSITDGTFFENQELIKAIDHAKKNNSNLHLMGLLSSGKIHAQIDHLFALLELVKKQNFNRVCVHIFSDGRDSHKLSAIELVSQLQRKMEELQVGKVCSIIGRFYAMDRDNRWERTQRAYDLLVNGEGTLFNSPVVALSAAYKKGETDEYISPLVIGGQGEEAHTIRDNDSVVFFNFRSDRARQITEALTDPKFKEFKTKKLQNLYFVCMIPYGNELTLSGNVRSAFGPQNLSNTLSEVIANNNLPQFHIAETEKYAHVTYFFNGGRETPFTGEERQIIPSPKVITYDLQPEMSVAKVTDETVKQINSQKFAFILINFANPDMVGHTGNFQAAIEAAEEVDKMIKKIYDAVEKNNGVLMITADHGNIEEMLNPRTGKTSTQHSNNPVPFILIDKTDHMNYSLKTNGILANIAPTILEVMHLAKPAEMTEESLIVNSGSSFQKSNLTTE